MDVLELEETSVSSTPKGIVLTLVGMGSEGGNGRESRDCPKSIRMYNLASLANLAQWACDTKVRFIGKQSQKTEEFLIRGKNH